MKRYFLSMAFVVVLSQGIAQEFGLSFSYFIPHNGEFSMPISPFSFRGVGVELNKFVGLETGITLYRMSGLNIRNLPFESKPAMAGPNFTLFVPGELVIRIPGRNFEFDIKGGGFVYYSFNQKLNYGNIDRALKAYEGWDIANSAFTYTNHAPGYGVHAGVELQMNITSQFGASLELNYLIGSSALPLTGSYTGGAFNGVVQTVNVDYTDARLDFTGLEVSIGVFMRSGGGAPKKRRR